MALLESDTADIHLMTIIIIRMIYTDMKGAPLSLTELKSEAPM